MCDNVMKNLELIYCNLLKCLKKNLYFNKLISLNNNDKYDNKKNNKLERFIFQNHERDSNVLTIQLIK